MLLNSLLPFQLDGVRFGLQRGGRCLIADEMGLGKTLQVLVKLHIFALLSNMVMNVELYKNELITHRHNTYVYMGIVGLHINDIAWGFILKVQPLGFILLSYKRNAQGSAIVGYGEG